jgi:prepilin-type N-terminal cleavage/methylation domain-containing protein
MSVGTPSPALSGRQSGLTLIEIMVTVLLLSVMVLGISGLWANVSGDFVALTIRQKAIFVLNGEMARLSALFRFNQFTFVADNSRGYNDIGPKTRDVFPDSSSNPVDEIVVTSTQAIFNCGDNSCAGNVLHIANAVSGTPRNYVWIDQARNIVGELSWRFLDKTMPANAAACSAASCRELTVYLRFPLRYQDDVTVPKLPEFGREETLSLITIVGQRP